MNILKRKWPGRNGVALIAVLGFLSVLVIMAVALLISMRTERLASEAAQDDVACRILLEGALSRAMSEVDVANWSGTNRDIRRPKVAAIAVSAGSTNLGSSFQLLGGEATNWLPKMYLSSGDLDYNGTNKAALAQWILVRDVWNPVPNQRTNVIGRVAYACFDCSGLIDANLISTMWRSKGTSVGEISYGYLPEAAGVNIAVTEFQANRTHYDRFMTLSEIYYMNYSVSGTGFPRPAMNQNSLNNLTPYSLCYDAGWWDWISNTWNAVFAGAPVNIGNWSQTHARNVFRALGYANATATAMAVCYGDYVDSDSLPGGTGIGSVQSEIPCCETIPMINEVIFTNELRNSGGKLISRAYIDVELWYPFLGYTNNDTYSVSVSGDFLYPAALPSPRPPANRLCAGTYNFSVTRRPFGVLRCGPFTVVTNSLPAGQSMVFRFRPRSVSVLLNGTTVCVDSYTKNFLYIPIPMRSPAANAIVRGARSLSVRDPRLNHSNSEWKVSSIVSPGRINSAWGTNMGWSLSSRSREGTNMYVRNGPMQSVAELGFIPTGLAWSTIDLFSRQGRDLLAKFRTANVAAGMKIYTNGFVNPNTLFTNVLIAAFRNAPIEAYPGDPSPLRVTFAMARDIAAGMYEVSSNATISGSNVFDSSAGWVATRAFRVGGTLSQGPYPPSFPNGLDNNQKESIIRNSYRLFNPNQNLYTFVIAAQKVIDQDIVMAEKRAVAVVWRDPFPDPATGRHEMFVRTFKYLDE